MRPTEAVKNCAAGLFSEYAAGLDDAAAVGKASDDFGILLGALRDAGVDPLDDGLRERYLKLFAASLRHGRHEAEVLHALISATDAAGDWLDAADRAQNAIRKLAELVNTSPAP